MNAMRFLIFAFVVALLNGCITPTVAVKNTAYSEDLSKYRVRFAESTPLNQGKTTTGQPVNNTTAGGQPAGHINTEMETLMRQVAESNKTLTKSQGFKVQIYSGASRDEANAVLKDVSSYTSERAELSYTQPNYRVRIGNYFSRVDAYRTYVQVKKAYPNAIIIPDKIDIELKKYQR